MVRFVKGHGLGNDYLVIDEAELDAPLSAGAIVRICDRNLGPGSDGILLLSPSAVADFRVRILNPDGSEAEKSGNGLRILAKFLRDHGYTSAERFTVETLGGVVTCRCHERHGRVTAVTVDMGAASFRAEEIPVRGVAGEAVAFPLALASDLHLIATAVTVGNPHCVIFVERLDEAECRRLGPLIERHRAFPNRTNVQFARATAPDSLEILIWERGAGYTLASGSSSCAAAAAAVRTGACRPGPIGVRMPGGVLEVDVARDWSLRLTGPVEEVYSGTLSAGFVADYVSAAPLRPG